MLNKCELQGPAELLGFVRTQLEDDLDAARTAAFIITDLAVEIMVKNALSSRRHSSWGKFPELIERLHADMPEALNDLSVNDVMRWHRQRNDLQHKHRMDLIPKRSDLDGYLQAATRLFKNLGGGDLPLPNKDTRETAILEFNDLWMQIESELQPMRVRAERRYGPLPAMLENHHLLQKWVENGDLAETATNWFPILNSFRHHLSDPAHPPSKKDIDHHCGIAKLVLELLKERYVGP